MQLRVCSMDTFVEPRVVRSPVALSFGLATLSLPGGVVHSTRGFDGTVPGPTIRVAPGENLKITLRNQLGVPQSEVRVPNNEFQLFNTTSLHTHGLHVSPRRPADDAFFRVLPGDSADYAYHIPSYHAPGTHWYHPHVHGASTLQVGGGALGMLIIDDPPGLLPPAVAALDEHHLVITDIRPASLKNVARRYDAACREAGGSVESCREPLWGDPPAGTQGGDLDRVILVNGRVAPTLGLEAGRWYRLRLLYGSSGGGAAEGASMMGRRLGDWSGDDLLPAIDACDTQLIAKDGIYLRRAPRPIEFGYMVAGSRADWLVRCPVGAHAMTDRSTGTALVQIDVAPSAALAEPPILPFAVSRPCYLVDLFAANVDASHEIDLPHMSFGITTDGRSTAFDPAARPAAVLPVGGVTELLIGGTSTMHHVFHMHVNPFQLQDGPHRLTRNAAGNYFERGDWHDTIRAPMSGGGMMSSMHAAPLRVRLQTDFFTGTVPVHCHYLVHEDQGMMTTIQIEGREGARFEGAERLDARCYRDATPAPSLSLLSVEEPTFTNMIPSAIVVGLSAALVVVALHVVKDVFRPRTAATCELI